MLLFLFIVWFPGTYSARILGIFPFPSVSHQVVFNTYIQGILKQGHEVVVFTPSPTQTENDSVTNLTEIDIGYIYNDIDAILNRSLLLAKRGVIRDVHTMFEIETYESIANMTAEVFKNPQVKRIIEDKSQHFDLIVIEALMNYHLISSKFFNAPVILLSSFHGFPESYEIMGAVSRHPVLYPNLLRTKFRDLSTWETIIECYNEYKIMKRLQRVEELENKLLQQNFGPDAPSVQELKNNVAMLFLGCHPLFASNRPVPPGVIFLGSGLHLKPVSELPQELKSYLDNSKRGVIYISFGNNARHEFMHKDLLEVFLDAFEMLPYDVLWKYTENLERMPRNLKIQKWFPQRDLLNHPNIKAFVTQGGQQSTDEAINSGVPLIGIPMMSDQWYNTNKYVQFGIGVELDALTLTANDLSSAIETVIDDKSFKENIMNLKTVMYDQPQSPLERAVWWTEHVLRHGGAGHLRSPAANMSYWEYLMLDIFMPIFLGFLIFILIVCFLVILTVRKALNTLPKKSKSKLM